MSTHVVICKKPSGHNLEVIVANPGDAQPRVHVLEDNQFVEVMVYGDGTLKLSELDKPKT
jgi:hypothetical protein